VTTNPLSPVTFTAEEKAMLAAMFVGIGIAVYYRPVGGYLQ
jgi:hypothetical protein